MVDQLAADFISNGQPVIFLEQNEQMGWLGNRIRYNRFAESYSGGGTINYPLVMVDGGHQVTQGAKSNYYTAYKALVDAELGQAPEAVVNAVYRRVNNHLEFSVSVTNQSGVTLSQSANDATVFVIVYEDVVPTDTTSKTSRLDRAVVYQSIAELENNASASFLLNTGDLDPAKINFSKLHAVAFVDYRPGGKTGPYDMLQAAVAETSTIYSTPVSLSLTVNPASRVDPQTSITINGTPVGASWSVISSPTWVAVTPGTVGSPSAVSVDMDALNPCKNNGTITIALQDDPSQAIYIPVTVNFSPAAALAASPASLNLVINPNNPQDLQSAVQLTGAPPSIPWSVTAKPTWTSVSPSTGTTTSSPVVKTFVSAMQPGITYQGKVTFASPSCPSVTRDVPINVVYPTFTLSSTNLSFLVDPYNPSDPGAAVQTSGYPATNTWIATSNNDWLAVTPLNGAVGSSFNLKIDHTKFPTQGEYQGLITVVSTYSGNTMTQTISVRVSYKPPHPLYLTTIGNK